MYEWMSMCMSGCQCVWVDVNVYMWMSMCMSWGVSVYECFEKVVTAGCMSHSEDLQHTPEGWDWDRHLS